jgi:hypothetical protein
MSLYDEHLKQALRNAPDRELAPKDLTRAAVLAYAKQSLKPQKKSWYASGLSWLGSLHMENWQLASAGSVFASIMILVVFWHEQPKDSAWMPAEPTQIATVELADDKLSETTAGATFAGSSADGAVAELKLDNQSSPVKSRASASAAKLAKGDDAERVTVTPLAALPAAPKESVVIADMAQLKSIPESDSANVLVKPMAKKYDTPIVAPTLTLDSDKVVVARGIEKAETKSVNREPAVKNDVFASGTASNEALMHPAEQVQSEQGVVQTGRAESKSKAVGVLSSAENATLAAAISKEGGFAVASRDIKTGLLRNLYIGAYVPAQDSQECAQLKPNEVPRVDAVTGYRVEFISGCYSTAVLIKEVEIYNQTMHAWHARDGK